MEAKKCQYRTVVKYYFNPVTEPRREWTNALLHEFTRNGEAIVETENGAIHLLRLGGESGEEYTEIRMGHRPIEPSLQDQMEKFTKEFNMSQVQDELDEKK